MIPDSGKTRWHQCPTCIVREQALGISVMVLVGLGARCPVEETGDERARFREGEGKEGRCPVRLSWSGIALASGKDVL